jgi:hypothetical protein
LTVLQSAICHPKKANGCMLFYVKENDSQQNLL